MVVAQLSLLQVLAFIDVHLRAHSSMKISSRRIVFNMEQNERRTRVSGEP